MELKLPANPLVRRLLGLAPAILFIFFFMVLPIALLGVYSFKPADSYGGVEPGFSMDAWIQLFFELDLDDTLIFEPVYLQIIWRSVVLASIGTTLSFLIGFPVAWYIVQQDKNLRDILLLLVTIPFWTNLLIRTFAIMEVIRNEGIVNNLLTFIGVIDEPIQMLYTDFSIMLGMTYVYLPLMILPLYASMEKLDFRLVEAGYDLYATRFRVLRRVILPLVKPGLVAGSILVFIPSLGAYVTPRVLGGGKNMMLGNLIELQFGQGRNWPLGAALSITLLAIVMVALLVYVRTAQKSTATHG